MIDLHWRTATWRFTRAFVIPTLLGLLLSGSLQAAEGLNANDEERIVQRLKQEVMQELQKGDFLKKEIAAGIQDYINKQREAEQNAQLERERKAAEKAKNVRRASATISSAIQTRRCRSSNTPTSSAPSANASTPLQNR